MTGGDYDMVAARLGPLVPHNPGAVRVFRRFARRRITGALGGDRAAIREVFAALDLWPYDDRDRAVTR